MFDSVRMRLTLWYVGVLSIVLAVFSVGVYLLVERTLYNRLDTNLRTTLKIATAALALHAGLSQTDRSFVAGALKDLHFPNQVIAVLDSEGRVIAHKPEGMSSHLRLPPNPLRATESTQFYELPESKPDTDDSCRGAYQLVKNSSLGASYLVVVTQSSEFLEDRLDLLKGRLIVAIGLALLLVGFGGWFLAQKSLAPVAAMAESTQRITAENLDERLPVMNSRDELGRLASNFNDLLARLSASFARQRQFMADASHELRTPVSVMRTAAQVTLERTQRQESEYRVALCIIEQQTQRLSRIVEDMFTLARADSGGIVVQTAELYLDEILREAAHTAAVLATRKGIKLEIIPLHGIREEARTLRACGAAATELDVCR